jgi:hypothetical protein
MAAKKKKTTSKKKKGKWVKGATITLTLNSNMIEEAAEMANKGLFARQIAAALGVPHNTYKSWLERGREELRQYVDGGRKKNQLTLKSTLVLAVEKADALMCLDVHESILNAKNRNESASGGEKLKLLKILKPNEYTEERQYQVKDEKESIKKTLEAKLSILLEAE